MGSGQKRVRGVVDGGSDEFCGNAKGESGSLFTGIRRTGGRGIRTVVLEVREGVSHESICEVRKDVDAGGSSMVERLLNVFHRGTREHLFGSLLFAMCLGWGFWFLVEG